MDAGKLFVPPLTGQGPAGSHQIFEMDQVTKMSAIIEDLTGTADGRPA